MKGCTTGTIKPSDHMAYVYIHCVNVKLAKTLKIVQCSLTSLVYDRLHTIIYFHRYGYNNYTSIHSAEQLCKVNWLSHIIKPLKMYVRHQQHYSGCKHLLLEVIL